VDVASLLVFDSQIDQIRFAGGRFKLKGFHFVTLTGSDCQSFLHNFLTTNVNNLKENNFHISTRLNIRAQMQFYVYVIKRKKDYVLAIPKAKSKKLLEELDKYIIAEDVEFEKADKLNAYIYFDPTNNLHSKEALIGIFLGEKVKMLFQEEPTPGFEKIQPFALKTFSYLSGWPIGDENFGEDLINTLFLNEVAVDYSKGCFLGQETAAKIHNNRGGATFPVLISIGEAVVDAQPGDIIEISSKSAGEVSTVFIEKDETFICAILKRDFLIEQKQIAILIKGQEFIADVFLYPYFEEKTNQEKSKALLEAGLELFQEDLNEDAKTLLEQAIKIFPNNADAYESMGVLLGREGKFEEAIKYMDKLSKVDPHSVMAHTNKSLYLMKLGKIEEAEEEKAQATVKTFEKLGREAKEKKAKEEEESKVLEELKSREKMFQEVLELDEADEFANIQLASIKLKLGDTKYVESKFDYLEDNFKNNPEMYLVLSRYLKTINKLDEKFKDLISAGIELAAKKGNQKILGELNQLR
jgi:folate-binding Fe-S cluster repair protein YgfZ/Tfp pilus assembly protein PilF